MLSPEQINLARAEIAKRRAELDADQADLEAAERVWHRYGNAQPVIAKIGRKRGEGGIPPQFANALVAIDEQGGSITRAALRAEIDARRDTPISDNGYATLLSNMRAEHIETEGDIVRRKRIDEGAANVS